MNKISEILKDTGRTKTWLARKLGVSRVTINNYCKDKGLNKWKLEAIARALGVEPKELEDEASSL